jgi:hypothetical protein
MSKKTGMNLIAVAILAFAGTAQAQVYGTNDNPYELNPFASNMVVPQDPAPANPPQTAAPAAAPQQQSTQQQTAASAADAKKETSPDGRSPSR